MIGNNNPVETRNCKKKGFKREKNPVAICVPKRTKYLERVKLTEAADVYNLMEHVIFNKQYMPST